MSESQHILQSTTFVSAYYTLESTPFFNHHPEEWNPNCIFELARTGIYLCLYIGPNCAFEEVFLELEKECPNFKLMPYRLYYKDMWSYKEVVDANPNNEVELPASRNQDKDTLEYMVYMNSRPEIMEDAISENIWETTHFAWIDFNVVRLFKNPRISLQHLREIAHFRFAEGIHFPGCWPKLSDETARGIATNIYWRFCCSFFIGDAKSIAEFANLYREYFPVFLKEYRVFPWDANFWAWLEWKGVWNPIWYRGDHNDSLLAILPTISADTYAQPLSLITGKQEYTYPEMGGSFLPGSASYLEYNGRHYLNTRFVNYWMYPSGYYRFHNTDMVIENRNFLSELEDSGDELTPLYYREMDKTLYSSGVELKPLEIPVREKRVFSEGLEDIRLYLGKLGQSPRFIATNVDYSPNGRNRMVVGTYDVYTATYHDCVVVIPPDENSWCEKNWIPIMYLNEEHFIYKWSPMEVGRVNPDTNKLEIVLRHEVGSWLFSKMRGSTIFVDAPRECLPVDMREDGGQYLVGLTHFSEEHSPRHYYHMVVLLEKTTLKPVRYSRAFYFEKLSIEFCIGMAVRGEEYWFWISRFDRDPIYVKAKIEGLPLDNIVLF